MLVPAGRRMAVPARNTSTRIRRGPSGVMSEPGKPGQNRRSGCGVGRAGAMGGARAERPRQARKGRMTWGSVITAMNSQPPEHLGEPPGLPQARGLESRAMTLPEVGSLWGHFGTKGRERTPHPTALYASR